MSPLANFSLQNKKSLMNYGPHFFSKKTFTL